MMIKTKYTIKREDDEDFFKEFIDALHPNTASPVRDAYLEIEFVITGFVQTDNSRMGTCEKCGEEFRAITGVNNEDFVPSKHASGGTEIVRYVCSSCIRG